MPAVDNFGIQPNVLEKFTSYTTVFTLSALTSNQLNFPDSTGSYKNNNLGRIILRSAAGRPDNRVSTSYKTNANPTGKFDFYIDNVEIGSLMTYDKRTKGTNSTNISFEIIEPYSLGLFLQSLQIAAAEVADKGVLVNYIDVPYLLTIEFIGYDENGNVVVVNDVLNRHIPFMWGQVEMDVSASGCRYKCTATPYNESALADQVNLLKSDIKISGTTVQEILQTGENSLQRWLNDRSAEMAKQGSETGKEEYVPDEIVIIFPKDNTTISTSQMQDDSGQSAKADPNQQSSSKQVQEKLVLNKVNKPAFVGNTAGSVNLLVQNSESLNDIGKSPMGFDLNTGGDSQLRPKDQIQQDPNKPNSRKQNFYDPKDKVFKFPKGSSVINAITEVLLMSEYCKKNVVAPSDKSGFKKWFRIETQVFLLKPTVGNNNRAKTPKLFVFKVVEYLTHEHRFKPPASQPQGYAELKKNAVKEYNYIYTGKNVDILNFSIQLKAGLFTTAYADKNALAGSVYPQINGQGAGQGGQPTNDESNRNSQERGVPSAPVGELHKRYTNPGGGPNDDYRSLIAKNFYESLLNSQADMLNAEIEIIGDPYYIADSGMGNFSDTPINFNENSNGSMNYQSGDVDVIINFRTPIDYNSITGQLDFASGLETTGFSGLYHVQEVTNNFKNGKFTQTLKAIRRPVQEPAKDQGNTNSQRKIAEKYNVPAQSEQAKLLAQQEEGFEDQGQSATVKPGTEPKKAVDAVGKGSREGQVEYTFLGIRVPGWMRSNN